MFNTSLAVAARDAVNQGKDTDTNPKNDIDDKDFATAASWNDIQHAANLGAKGVKLTGDISASGDLNINSTFTIESAKDATSNYSLNLGQNSIINNGNLTLDNITVNGSITGKFGTKITYTTTAEIKKLENECYVLVKDGYTDSTGHSEFTKENDNHVYEVIMQHGTVTYNPHDNLAKPGEPINPNDPNSPKVTDNDVDYSKSVKEAIHYVGAGNQTPSDNVQNVTWTRSITVDRVTGNIISSTKWQPSQIDYKQVNTPVINGYHADVKSIPATKVTEEDITKTVTYTPNGQSFQLIQMTNQFLQLNIRFSQRILMTQLK